MKINNAGYNYRHKDGLIIKRATGSGDYVFILFKTPAVILLNNKLIHTPTNTAIIYDKHTPHWYGHPQQEFANDWFHFELTENDLEMFNRLQIPFDTPFNLENALIFSNFVKDICFELHSDNLYKNDTVALYANLIFIKLAEKIHHSSSVKLNPYFNVFSDLRTKIFNHPTREWKIDDISNSLSLSRSRFQHLYKTFFGVSAISDVICSRIERAQYLLYSSTLPIETIAYSSGYKNVTSFIRQFKNITGMTPSEYRKQMGYSKQMYIHSAGTNTTLDFEPVIETETTLDAYNEGKAKSKVSNDSLTEISSKEI